VTCGVFGTAIPEWEKPPVVPILNLRLAYFGQYQNFPICPVADSNQQPWWWPFVFP
jgi:hypothetical protein